MTKRLPLPIDEVLPELITRLTTHAAAVLQAPTGAGKTTRVPPALDAADLAGGRQIIMLEPRRVAARAAARRIAAEQDWKLGAEVGYQIRFERRASRATRILVVTEGILVRRLQDDPFLETVGALLFDEFHERSLDTDLALAMARRVQREVRPDLKIIVMSATLDPAPVAAFLGDAPVVHSAGRLHPVAIHYLDRPDPRPLATVAVAGVRQALAATHGDVLTFLPGVGEIRRAAEHLAPTAAAEGFDVLPLYGDLPPEAQDAVLAPRSRRKVVLATNVAETSITIDGITAVVDSGYARILRFDPGNGLDRLEVARISRAAADQRAGRAGRQGPGSCWRLWTQHDDRSLQPRELPEIRRVDLAAPVLQLLAWGEADPAAFGWFEAPEPAARARAMTLLRDLGAIDANGLTRRGRRMARLPVHPRLARLVIAGHRAGLLQRSARLAALLAERDPVHRPAGGRPMVAMSTASSDLLDRLEAVEAAVRGGYGETALGPVHTGRARQIRRAGDDLARRATGALGPAPQGARESEADGNKAEEHLLRALLAAYPDRVARRREPGSRRAVMVGGRGVRLAEMSAVRSAALFLAIELDSGRAGAHREALVRRASAVEPAWLPAANMHKEELLRFDSARGRVAAFRLTRYRDLVLTEREVPTARGPAATQCLAAAAAEQLATVLDLDRPDRAGFLARLRCLATWMPELQLPTIDDAYLAALLPSLCAGQLSLDEVRQAPLLDILRGNLDHPQRQALAHHAPEHFTVPSGSHLRLAYEPGKPPVLAVRIQELFGLRETPRVADGRVPVLLHLLAPNMRPQQVTQDLAGFWTRTYPEVRKELQGRYPKHAWPDDPLAAPPERRPRRRRR